MTVVSPDGKCWFGVESKTFEISVDEAKGKVLGTVCKRSPNFSSWIHFSGKGFSFLLEGVETCCSLKVGERFKKAWMEGGRRYQLELRSNKAGRFLFCTVWDVEGKKFSLAFLEGRGVVGGWQLLVGKLRSLGFSSAQRDEEHSASPSGGRSLNGASVGKKDLFLEIDLSDSTKIQNAVWLETKNEVIDSNKEVLRRSLVGRWGSSVQPPFLGYLKSWAQSIWMLRGHLRLALLGGPFILFEFEDVVEAERVLYSKVKWFKGKCLLLDWWNPSLVVSQRTGRAEKCG